MACGPCKTSMYGCGGQGCARAEIVTGRRMALRDPHAILLSAERQGTMSGILPVFVTQGAVRAQKDRLDPSFATTNTAIGTCATVSPAQRAAWRLFFASWIAYRDSPETFWGVTSEYDAGTIFETALGRWQDDLSSHCALGAPRIVGKADVQPDLSAVKWVAGALIAIAVVWGVRTVVR